MMRYMYPFRCPAPGLLLFEVADDLSPGLEHRVREPCCDDPAVVEVMLPRCSRWRRRALSAQPRKTGKSRCLMAGPCLFAGFAVFLVCVCMCVRVCAYQAAQPVPASEIQGVSMTVSPLNRHYAITYPSPT
jgi:hypothetical protein